MSASDRAYTLSPSYAQYCPICEARTWHAGTTDERGRELGSACLECERRRSLLVEQARHYNASRANLAAAERRVA